MAASGSGDSNVVQQLERIEGKLKQIEEASARLKTTGRAMAVVVTVLVVALAYFVLVNPLLKIRKDPKPIATAMQTQLEERLLPSLKSEAKALSDDVVPAYKKAVAKVYDERKMEVMTKVETEYLALYDGLTDQLAGELNDFSYAYSQQMYKRLLVEFPEIKGLETYPDPKKPDTKKSELIIGSLDTVSSKLVHEFFSTHFNAIEKLEREFNLYEVPREVSAMTPEELHAYTSELLIDYVTTKFDKMANDVELEKPVSESES